MHEVKIAVKVPVFICFAFVVPHRVELISEVRIVWMSPVDYRVVDADLETFRPNGLREFLHEIAVAWRVHRIEVSVFRVEETETVMVFCREDHIFHSCFFCKMDPLPDIAVLCGEFIHVFIIFI